MAKWRVSSYAETSVAGVARNIGRAMKPWEGLARATSRKRARKSVEGYNDWRSEWEIEESVVLLLEGGIRTR
jgi:hypothetical protein